MSKKIHNAILIGQTGDEPTEDMTQLYYAMISIAFNMGENFSPKNPMPVEKLSYNPAEKRYEMTVLTSFSRSSIEPYIGSKIPDEHRVKDSRDDYAVLHLSHEDVERLVQGLAEEQTKDSKTTTAQEYLNRLAGVTKEQGIAEIVYNLSKSPLANHDIR